MGGCRYIYHYFTGLYITNYTGFSLLLDSFGRNSRTHQMERTEIMQRGNNRMLNLPLPCPSRRLYLVTHCGVAGNSSTCSSHAANHFEVYLSVFWLCSEAADLLFVHRATLHTQPCGISAYATAAL